MRTASTLLFGVVGLASVALAPAARAQEAAPVAEVSATPARPKRIQVSVAFIPMAMGKFDFKAGGMPTTVDTAFIPGYTLQASYEVMQGLSVGLAPQAFFGVKPKDDPDGSNVDPSGTEITSKEYDLMVRLAYAYPVVESIRLYAELLPGYSLIIPSFGHTSKGFVLAADVGSAIDLGNRAFINVAGGYQIGFQHLPSIDSNAESRTRFVRVVLGGGVRF